MGGGDRRRWSDDEKARAVEASLEPDAVVSAVARQHGVTRQQLFTWRRKAEQSELGEPHGDEVGVSLLQHVAFEPLGEMPRIGRLAGARRSRQTEGEGALGRARDLVGEACEVDVGGAQGGIEGDRRKRPRRPRRPSALRLVARMTPASCADPSMLFAERIAFSMSAGGAGD